MKILFVNINDIQPIPAHENEIRADTYVSVSLALSLKKRGHDVFFLCPKDSKINVKKIFTSTKSLQGMIPIHTLYGLSNRKDIISSLQVDFYLKLIEACKRERFDLVHLHTNNPLAELIVSKELKTPFLFTLHGVSTYPELESQFKKIFKKRENYFVSISKYQRIFYPGMKFLKTVYNGLELEKFPFHKEGGDHMNFSGRLKKIKGVKEAIEISKITGRKITISGAASFEGSDKIYFKKEITPQIEAHKDLITYLGFLKRNEIGKRYGNSKLVLFPIQWEEPFGLVMIESMATGTPVIAFARGSVPEIIKDGITGFLVNPSEDDKRGNWFIKKSGIQGMVEAVQKIYRMPEKEYQTVRKKCREHVEENFTVEKMVDGYEKVYYEILEKQKK